MWYPYTDIFESSRASVKESTKPKLWVIDCWSIKKKYSHFHSPGLGFRLFQRKTIKYVAFSLCVPLWRELEWNCIKQLQKRLRNLSLLSPYDFFHHNLNTFSETVYCFSRYFVRIKWAVMKFSTDLCNIFQIHSRKI